MEPARDEREPSGITTAQPTAIDPAFVGLLMKIGADAVAGVKGGKELLSGLRSQDLFVIAIVDAKYDGPDYVLTLRFTNASGHGAYVEDIRIAAAQSREGRDLAQPRLKIGSEISTMTLGDSEHVTVPLYVPPMSDEVTLEVSIIPKPDTWAAHDAFGKLTAVVRPLNEEADIEKHVTFAIRHPKRGVSGRGSQASAHG